MGRPRNKTAEEDRLRSLMVDLVDLKGGKLRPVLREAGIDVDSESEGGTNYQAVNRWFGGRSVPGGAIATETSGDAEAKPGRKRSVPKEFFPRSLPEAYRRILFAFIRDQIWDEYIKPMPVGETWVTPDEMATWLQDFYNSGQSGEAMQRWTDTAKRVFDEIWGIKEADDRQG